MAKNDEVLIIQFIHPGAERTDAEPLGAPCVVNGVRYDFIRRWGPEGEHHRRKFIVNPGDYIDGKGSVRDEGMHFWCEAEWDTLCRKLQGAPSDILPKYEHIARNIPKDLCSKPGQHLNTDPYVFGDAFKYCCCQQWSRRHPTALHDLPVGSIILFGSCKFVNKVAGFYLDTVFVVDSKLGEYSDGREMSARIEKMEPEYQRKVSPIYRKRVLENLYFMPGGKANEAQGCLQGRSATSTGSANSGKTFSLYIGKVFDGDVYKPFSFVPVIPGNDRYPRPLLASFDDGNGNALISPDLQQGYKKTAIPRSVLCAVWKKLLAILPKGYKYAWHLDE